MMVVSFALLCLPFTCALGIDTCVAGAPGCGTDSLEADVNVNLLQSAYSMRSGVLGNHDPAGSDGEHKMPDMPDTGGDGTGGNNDGTMPHPVTCAEHITQPTCDTHDKCHWEVESQMCMMQPDSMGHDTHGSGHGSGGNNGGTMSHPVTCAEHITQPTCDTLDKCHWEVESQMCMMQPSSHDTEPCKDDCPPTCTECEPACTDAAKGGNATQCYECVERTGCQKCLECHTKKGDHGHGHDDHDHGHGGDDKKEDDKKEDDKKEDDKKEDDKKEDDKKEDDKKETEKLQYGST